MGIRLLCNPMCVFLYVIYYILILRDTYFSRYFTPLAHCVSLTTNKPGVDVHEHKAQFPEDVCLQGGTEHVEIAIAYRPLLIRKTSLSDCRCHNAVS